MLCRDNKLTSVQLQDGKKVNFHIEHNPMMLMVLSQNETTSSENYFECDLSFQTKGYDHVRNVSTEVMAAI